MKCDESRPSCLQCLGAGIVCRGYEKTIFFDVDTTSDVESGRVRRPLFTDEERQIMTDMLIASTGHVSTSRLLDQLDEICDELSDRGSFQLFRGPFGAFQLGMVAQVPSNQLHGTETTVICDEDADLEQHQLPLPDQDQPLYVDISETADIVGAANDLWNSDSGLELVADSRVELQPIEDMFLLPPFGCSSPAIYDLYLDFDDAMPEMNLSPTPSLHQVVPDDAVRLLKHYAQIVPKVVSPMRNTKTPWHVLFLPLAKQSLAALTLGESLDPGSLCAFYGTLAMSAFSLGSIHDSTRWTQQGNKYKQQAREYAKAMLKMAYTIPKKIKYKTVLIALLTMTQLSLFSSCHDQTECYSIEAEKFIRLRGLNRQQKSRKVRLLHHCYAFERIIYESTAIALENSVHRSHVRNAIESSGMDVFCVDGLSFRPARWVDLGRQMLLPKSQLEGENDLHLEKPGSWPPTLYPEIFGVPEQILMTLSFIVRLGKEKDAADQAANQGTFRLHDFLSRAKAIETWIGQLRRLVPSTDFLEVEHGATRDQTNLLHAIHDAMQNALAIYFYRRIYDIESSMLQARVHAVRECIQLAGEQQANDLRGSLRFMWPAFIAACEAEDSPTQIAFSEWFRNAGRYSGFDIFTTTVEKIEQIWLEKSRGSGERVTWLDHARRCNSASGIL